MYVYAHMHICICIYVYVCACIHIVFMHIFINTNLVSCISTVNQIMTSLWSEISKEAFSVTVDTSVVS